jgi:pSer/pThr/pTyr-binding forkhead associated (FHA) protein
LSFGNGVSLERLKRDLPTDVEGIRRKWGDAFLLVHTLDITSSNAAKTKGATLSGVPRTATPLPAVVIYVVRRKPESPFDWISIGRNDGNDIWVPHASVSRFHALLRETTGGGSGEGMAVHDAKSANGSIVEGVKAPRAGDGPPIVLRAGMTVRFGDITATFLDAKALHAMLTA